MTHRDELSAIQSIFLLCVVACIGAGCAAAAGETSGAPGCIADAGPVELELPMGAASHPMLVKGSLNHQCGALEYAFRAPAGGHLEWSYTGPAAHVVLTYPNGDTDGPLAPSTLLLPDYGRYTLRLHSNTMADDVDGPFTLRLRLLP